MQWSLQVDHSLGYYKSVFCRAAFYAGRKIINYGVIALPSSEDLVSEVYVYKCNVHVRNF